VLLVKVLGVHFHRPGLLIHTDPCGPMTNRSLGGGNYFLLFKDDYFGYHFIYMLTAKIEVLQYFKLFDHAVLRTDRGTEYTNWTS
jgi:hypothetical protein